MILSSFFSHELLTCVVSLSGSPCATEQLQSACSEQPQQVDTIRFLVEACPEAVKVPNDNGSLPLHVACAYKAPLDVIQFLVEQWSEAIKTANHNGCLPLHHACSSKVPFDVVEFLVKEWPEAIKIMDQMEGYLSTAPKFLLLMVATQCLRLFRC
jgi:hypothetical protein